MACTTNRQTSPTHPEREVYAPASSGKPLPDTVPHTTHVSLTVPAAVVPTHEL